jgi:hypothetical protein
LPSERSCRRSTIRAIAVSISAPTTRTSGATSTIRLIKASVAGSKAAGSIAPPLLCSVDKALK